MTERQFALAPNARLTGRATRSTDPLGSSSAAASSQTLERGPRRALPEDDVDCTEKSSS